MFGFPKILYDNSLVGFGQKLFNDVSLMFGISKPAEIFYTIKNGSWNDISIWETVSGRPANRFPNSANDDVYIKHTVNNTVSITVGNVYITGKLSVNQNFSVYGDSFKCSGILDMSSAGSNTLYFYGNNNDSYINNYIGGTSSWISYASLTKSQKIINIKLGYNNLMNENGGNLTWHGKYIYLEADCLILGKLQFGAYDIIPKILDCKNFNLTVTGRTDWYYGGFMRKLTGGNILFIGICNMTGFGSQALDFSSDVVVECRGGISFSSYGSNTDNLASWRFTTNNQTMTTTQASKQIFRGPITIENITLTMNQAGVVIGNAGIKLTDLGTINGTTAGSSLVLQSALYFSKLSSYTNSMTTGIFDYTTHSLATIGYTFNDTFTIPNTTYRNLVLYTSNNGSGNVKSLSADTLITGKLFTNFDAATSDSTPSATGATIFNTLGYNLTVNGQYDCWAGTTLKASVGNNTLRFDGLFHSDISAGNNRFNMPTNTYIEFRGGLTIGGYEIIIDALGGTSSLNFTTNNQTWANNCSQQFDCPVNISGAITITHTGGNGAILTGVLDGDNANSVFDNRTTNTGLKYRNSTQPMATGILETNAATNTWKYDKAGNQDVKGGTYRTLNFGTSGVKKLQGNVTVPTATYTVTGTATVDLNGYILTLT